MPEAGEKAEWIRSETAAKLRKRESLQHALSRHAGAICHPFSTKTMLSRRHQLSPSERASAHFSWREGPRKLGSWEKHQEKHDDTV
jgi:hypothetical protein